MKGTEMQPYDFPRYDTAELFADRIVHIVGILGALASVIWLIADLPPAPTASHAISIWIYGFALLCMLTASALYNGAAGGRIKSLFRRLDHAMIFVMIAGSYTPFAMIAFPEFAGHLLLGLIWALAIAGILLKTLAKPRTNFLSVGMYLGMAWVIIGFFPILVNSVSGRCLQLLILGGVVYSAGAVLHAIGRIRFHNVIWHIMVLVGAALQFGAITQLL